MEEETEDDDHFTLTSFEPLSPERKKSGLSRFIEGFTSKKFPFNLNESDDSREHGSRHPLGVHNKENGTQLNYKGENFKPKPGLLREDPNRNNDVTWKANSERKLGLRESSKVLTRTGVAPDRNTRTPSSVLGRLSLLISVERTAQQPSQSSSNLKKYWMPDKQCKVCYECGVKFNTFRRRHHCRLCGQIFCSQCCNEELSGHQIGYTGVLRVCVYCKKIVLAYTSSSDIDKNLKQLKQDLSLVGQQDSPGTSDGRTSSLDDPELNRSFDVLGVSAQEANLLKQDSLKQLWQQISAPKTGLELQSHRIRLRTYSNCLVGRELVDWLIIHRKVTNRSQAFQVCQGLQDSGWIEPLVNTRETVFKDDFVFYVPGPSASGDGSFVSLRSLLPDFVHPAPVNAFDDLFLKRKYKESLRNDADSSLSASHDKPITGLRRPGFVKNNSTSNLQNYAESFVVQFKNKSLSCEDLFLKVDTIKNEENKNETTELSASTSTHSPVLDHFVYVDDWFLSKSRAKRKDNASKNVEKDDKNVDRVTKDDLSMTQKENDEVAALEQLSSIHRRHISSFLAQLLDRVGLSQSWKDVVESLSLKVCEMVVPDALNNDDMDIRQYVKIKKLSGGEKSDCRIVSGVVCTKNVVHKKMATTMTEPKILMLSCPVDFQRVENKLTSLDPVVLQEEEFLKNYVGRIAALSPTIVLVEKTVTRLAQDMLLARGISVMLNVKPKLMTRISRCTEGDVLPSLDQGSRPNLGTCRNFKIEKYVFKNGSTKTLAYFEGCSPQLGSTIVIRGGNMRELSKVKHILRFMTFVVYNSKLEKFFIMDEFGTPFRSENEEKGKRSESGEGRQRKGAKDGETQGESGNERSFWKKSFFVGKQNKCLDDEFEVTPDMEGEEVRKGRDKKHEDGNLEVFNKRSITGNGDSSKGGNVVVNRESFQKVMSDVILCASPLISFPVPYILTLEGQRCELLSYMEEDLYWSPLFNDVPPPMADSPEEDFLDDVIKPGNKNVFMKDAHPFVFAVLTKNTNDLAAQTLLAHYRAEGGRITVRREFDFSVLKQKNGVSQNGIDDTDESDSVLFDKDFIDGQTDEECQITLPLMRDCFDPFLHQMIAILFSSYSTQSANYPHPCISPWTVFMEFYGKNDIALGCFLERYCFRSSYLCPNPNCDVPMVKHVRYFAHGNGAVYINMKNLAAPIPGFSKALLTWSWCKQCKQVTPIVPVSPEAWRLSFAKYLELRMYGTCYRRRATVSPCDHSLHQDHHQYFAFNNIVASLKYVPVKIYEVFLPPTIIKLLEEERQPQFWIQHIQAMSVRVYKLVDSISERIAMLKTEPFISNCVTEIGHDQGQLHEKIKVLERKAMLLLHPPPSPGEKADSNKWLEPHEMSTLEYEILDGLTLLKRMMCEYREKWNAQLTELVQLENEKKKTKSMDGKNTVSPPANNQSPNDDSLYSNWYASSVSQSEIKVSSSMSDNQDITKNTPTTPRSSDSSTSIAPATLIENESSSSSESETKVETLNETRFSNDSDKKFQRHSELWATLSREVHSTLKDTHLPDADKPGSKVKRTIRQLLPGVTFIPIRPPFPPHEHHLLPSSEIIPIIVNEKEPTSIIAYTLSTIDYQKKLHKIQDSMTVESDRESFTCVDMDMDGVCSYSTINESEDNLGRSRTRSEVETMSSASLLMNLDDFVDNYFECFDHESDDEETSSQDEAKNVSPPNMEPNEDKSPGNNPDIRNGPTSSETKDDVPADGIEKERPGSFNSPAPEVEYHIRHSFSDSIAKFFCVIYFGEQFRRIRKTFFPDGEEKYIRSLQYCLEWQAKGGKSGSSFCKTKDDRFVIKEMSRSEAQSFLDIAPYYFEHIGKSVKEKRPTLLAKILGVYRIGCTSKLTNTLIRKDLLVIDNLLYNCKADQVFDLKGSIRSRYVMSSEENNVLLDENLLEMILESPLFIRPHSKAVLSRAINQDTEFLAKHMVMDYSLLLGIEQDSSKLVVGIIDFIRTFTWDKKLEMYVKSTGILGGQGRMPTVVSPELYRDRFREAMQRYFLMIPSKWMGLGNELK